MKKCQDIQYLLTLYALGNLGKTSGAEVKDHLEKCKKCQKEFEEIKQGLNIINDVLEETADDNLKLSAERHGAILRASKIRETKASWITTHRPLLGIAASTILVFGITWAIVNSIQPMRSVECQSTDSLRSFADSFVQVDELETPEPLDVEFSVAGSGRSRSSRAAKESGASLGGDANADYSNMGYAEDNTLRSEGKDIQVINAKTRSKGGIVTAKSMPAKVSKPTSSLSSLPQPELDVEFESIDMAFDKDVNIQIPNDTPSPSSADVDAVAMVKSPVVLKGLYNNRNHGARRQAIKRYAGDVDLREEARYAQQHAVDAKQNKEQMAFSKSEERKKVADRSNKIEKGYISSQTESLSSSDTTIAGGKASEPEKEIQQQQMLMEPAPAKKKRDKSRGLEEKEIWAQSIRLEGAETETFDRKSEDDLTLENQVMGKTLEPAVSKQELAAKKDPLHADKSSFKETEEIKTLSDEIEVFSELAADEDDVGGEITARQSTIRATGVNPYVQTADNAFSTFSIDVDTASYNLSRRYMLAGLLPPPEIVRTEEFVNSFDYHYVPAANQTFRIYTDVAPSPFGHGQYMLKIGIKGKRIGREEQKRAVLTFLVDTSGSMKRSDRIGLIKKSLKLLLKQLDENDKVALVQYGTNARLVLEHTKVKDIKIITEAIDSLQCGGATDMEEGILLAYKVAAAGYINNSENKVLLLSDGVANIGEGVAESILTKIKPYIKQGITCSIYGFGVGNYDDAMLETLANKGNGIYSYIGNIKDAETIFSEDSAAILNLIASDVKIQVEFSPSVVKQYRQLGYENRLLTQQDFRNDTVDAGEIGSGQSVTALYELELEQNKPMDPWRNSTSGLQSGDVLAVVRVRYRDIKSGDVQEIEQKVRTRDIKNAFESMPTEYRLAVAVAEFAEQLRMSPYANNNFKDILKVIAPVANELPLDSKVQEIKNFIQYAPGMSR
jgi:Ca-activated chloride channel homolog